MSSKSHARRIARLFFTLFFLCTASGYAQARIAGHPSDFTCDPAGFTLQRETDGQMRLQGVLETPSPGYSYKIDGNDKSGQIQMSLNAPDGAALAVIDKITVNETLTTVDSYSDITIHLKKDFNWGPDKIVCTAIPYDPAHHTKE